MAIQETYETLTGADDAPVEEARNGAVHVAALTMTKLSDALIDPKLILAWLLSALGAPGAFIGALVPVREAGALLPQLFLARRVAASKRRRLWWAAGSALQGLSALALALAAFTLEGWSAGAAVVGALAVLACARAVCSVSYKDALARSIPKTRRGAVTGAAGSTAAVAALTYGALLAVGVIPLTVAALSAGVALAGALWIAAALLLTRLEEDGGADDPPEGRGLRALVAPLAEDPQLRRFIGARALLTVTALAPPFLILAASVEGRSGPGALGPLVIASAAAAILSSYVWGRLSDRSSRRTLIYAALGAAAALGLAALAALTTGGLFGMFGAAAAIFTAQIAYEGVRAGRKLHLTDMTDDANRARYTALSNSAIGLVLIAGGGFGVLADMIGPAWVLAIFAVLSALAAPVAATLDEVQEG